MVRDCFERGAGNVIPLLLFNFILVGFLGGSNDWMTFLAQWNSLSRPTLRTLWLQPERRGVEKRLSNDVFSALKYESAQPELLKRARATSRRSCTVRAVTGLSPLWGHSSVVGGSIGNQPWTKALHSSWSSLERSSLMSWMLLQQLWEL